MATGDVVSGELFWIVIRVIKAELVRSFCTFKGLARMAPYTVVEWRAADGAEWEVARTRPHNSGTLAFQWDHACRETPYTGQGSGDKVRFIVLHERFGGLANPNYCGAASIAVDDLLLGTLTPTGDCRYCTASTVELALHKRGERTGAITVQALLVRGASGGLPSFEQKPALTEADPALFETPVARIGVSGGTAPFFRLKLRQGAGPQPGPRRSPEYYIGKDLSHATDEVSFYEEAFQLAAEPNGGGLGTMLGFMFEYAGVVRCPVQGASPSQKPVDLLVLRNLYDGLRSLRLLDVKIGQQTADADWKGKSRVAALRAGILDGATNSSAEGFRLEGFQGEPPALASMNPLLDLAAVGVSSTSGSVSKLRKKAQRIMLQRMSASIMLTHFLDVHQVPADRGTEIATVRAPIELAELVLHEVVQRLGGLALACRQVPVPQKWIGSSVAIGFDCGQLPLRSQPEEEVRAAVRVSIFDWGRSELNTLQRHMELSDAQQRDRARFWGYYIGGIDRLLWESMRAYWHRFGCSGQWSEARINIYDFDSISENDFIGEAAFPLQSTPETTAVLTDARGAQVRAGADRPPATVTFSVEYRPLPKGSRLAGAWRVHVAKASHLPACDRLQARPASDPFAVLTALGSGRRRFRQQTSVVIASLDPEWGETLEVPVCAAPGSLEAALLAAASPLGAAAATELAAVAPAPLLPPEDAPRGEVEAALGTWRARLDTAATAVSGAARYSGAPSPAATCRPPGRSPGATAAPAAASGM